MYIACKKNVETKNGHKSNMVIHVTLHVKIKILSFYTYKYKVNCLKITIVKLFHQ